MARAANVGLDGTDARCEINYGVTHEVECGLLVFEADKQCSNMTTEVGQSIRPRANAGKRMSEVSRYKRDQEWLQLDQAIRDADEECRKIHKEIGDWCFMASLILALWGYRLWDFWKAHRRSAFDELFAPTVEVSRRGDNQEGPE